jgi:hypothetical protein
LARRASTLDPVVADLRAEIAARLPGLPSMPEHEGERRQARRVPVDADARLRVQDLTVRGRIQDVGSGGLFLRADILVEIGEAGTVMLHPGDVGVPVRVAWLRAKMDALGPGLGLAFDMSDAENESRALKFLLRVLDRTPE